MTTIKFSQYFNCEAFFYFGLKTSKDCEYTDEILANFCKRFFNSWPKHTFDNIRPVFEFIKLNEEKKTESLKKKFKKLFHKSPKKLEFVSEKLKYYKSVFEYYNVLLETSDEILDLMRHANIQNLDIVRLAQELDENKVQFEDKKRLMKESKVVLFCLTKSYLNSEMFKFDWEEVKNYEKDVLLVLLEDGLNYEYLNEGIPAHQVFNIYSEKYNPYGRRTFLYSHTVKKKCNFYTSKCLNTHIEV